jgi:hypothetical protein
VTFCRSHSPISPGDLSSDLTENLFAWGLWLEPSRLLRWQCIFHLLQVTTVAAHSLC